MPNCILIVDDNPTIRHMLRMTFEDISGLAVGEAENGREAIDKARESKPDLIVLDLSMPIMNGLELAHSQGRVAALAKRLATVDLRHDYGDTLGSQQLLRPGPHETLRPPCSGPDARRPICKEPESKIRARFLSSLM